MARDEVWDLMKEIGKENHRKRVAKTPDRIIWAKAELKKAHIEHEVKNCSTGQINCKDAYGNTWVFYASTGKIVGKEERGIKALIKLILRAGAKNE